MDRSKLTIPRVLYHWATHQSDTAAFIFKDAYGSRRVLTRADVYRLASRFAAILRRHDVRRGDLVCNTLPNSPERVVSDLGVILAGAVAMNGQIFLADGEDFIGSLQDSRCVAVILDLLELSGAKRVLNLLEQEVKDDGKVHFPKVPALRMIYECRWEGHGEQTSFMDTLEQESESYVADVTAGDLAYVWTTSGSTGFSKLVPRTHAQVLIISRQNANGCGMPYSETVNFDRVTLQDCAEPQDGDRLGSRSNGARPNATTPLHSQYVFFNNSPLGWSSGCLNAFFWHGATRVLLDFGRGHPDDLVAASWTLASQERCHYAFMVPFELQQFGSRKDVLEGSGFKFKVIGLSGQPMHRTILKEAVGNLCEAVSVFYGSQEHGELTRKFFVNPDTYQDGNNGKPYPGVELKVVDKNLQEIPSGGQVFGEILARSAAALEYYVGNAEAAQEMLLQDGWCRTGDIGYLDEEGDLFVLCRTSFSIMRGAYTLYPGWLESRIRTHPAVREVLVVPVPDPVLHQELCACVITTPEAEVTADELRDFCQGLFLTRRDDEITAVPRYFLFFSDFPTTVTGKTCRRSTAAEAKKRLFGESLVAPSAMLQPPASCETT